MTFSSSNLPLGATVNATSGVFAWTPGYDQAGNYSDIELAVMDDGDPMELDVDLITITVGDVNGQPVFTSIPPQEVLENVNLTFSVIAIDPDGDDFVLSASNLPSGATFNTGTGVFAWTPGGTQSGTYVVTIQATDDGTPSEVGTLDVVITVGDDPTPAEQAQNLVEAVISYDLPTNVENSYLANLKKIAKFIGQGQINAAIGQLDAFIEKVEDHYAANVITQAMRDNLVTLAQALLADLQ